jgi:hypothetical protein
MNAAVLEEQPRIVTPDPAIAAILAHRGPILIDFDETLYLRNSTEDFIDSAQPALFALILMRVLDALRPWRWTGGEKTRDVWRVRSILLFFPWTRRRWARRAQALADEGANTALISAVRTRALVADSQPPIITTLGFNAIVKPLANALGLPPEIRIVGSRLTTFDDRRDGKLRMVVRALGNETVRRALVLTDSRDDDALLDVCARPVLTVWPRARFRRALSGVYLPGQYLSIVKRPGERYISRGILQEDFALWVLASFALTAHPLAHVAALAFLLLSFWAIYEHGYVDNDRIAARFEKDPKLSEAYREAPVATPNVMPWVWAAVSGAIGAVLLHPDQPLAIATAVTFGIWIAVLVATYGAFALYNRLDKSTRIWLYSGLQLARSAAFVAVVPVTFIGALAIGAHVLAKWVPYYIYRVGGKHWPDESHFMPRLLFFVMLAVLVGFATGFASLLTGTAAALLAWNLFRARHELAQVLRSMSRVDRKQG